MIQGANGGRADVTGADEVISGADLPVVADARCGSGGVVAGTFESPAAAWAWERSRNRRRKLRKWESPLPESDNDGAERPGHDSWPGLLTCGFSGVSEGTRTPDTQDHNLVL
jgi:hypothetical protein